MNVSSGSSSVPDSELLAGWASQRSETAFHALVVRYGHLVHMAARRSCGDDALAADASQLVFIVLARKAPALLNHTSLAGWLHLTAVRTTRDLIDKRHRESRKLERFQAAMEPHTDLSGDSWKELQPVLDSALTDLNSRDREVLLLRFYRALSVKDVARTLKITTAAAQKRIDRATVRLREKLARRGCQTGGTLAGVLLAGFVSDTQAAVPAASIVSAKAISSSVSGGAVGIPFLAASSMKSTSVMIPTGILLVGGIWLVTQFRSISGLEGNNARIAKLLASDTSRVVTNSRESVMVLTALDDDPVDWVEVARQLRDSRRSGALDPHARLQSRIISMALDQVNAALDEIASVPLSADDRELLEERFAEEVYLKGGPRMVLERFLPVMETGSWKWSMGGYFKKWMDSSPDQAIPWLAKHVDEMPNLSFGFFDLSFHSLLASSPETASRLLEVIPPDRRLESLRSLSNRAMPEASQIAWAEVVREHIPEAITWPIMNWSDGDGSPFTMAEVSDYMERINANEEERKACIIAAGREGSAGDGAFPEWNGKLSGWLPEFRKWVASHEPGLVDEATGAALAGQSPFGITRETVELILEYHASSGNDGLLLPLLERDPTDEEVQLFRELAEQLSDQTLRKKHLERLK